MNERIKELVLAAFQPINDIASEGVADYHTFKQPWFQMYNEKFADLIVRECVQTLIDNTPERFTNESAEEDWDKGYDRAMKDCVHLIQEHFGVE